MIMLVDGSIFEAPQETVKTSYPFDGFTVVPDETYRNMQRDIRNYRAVMDMIDDFPADIHDMMPDWDFKTGALKEETFDEDL